MDLECVNKAQIGLVGSLAFFGWLAASFFLPSWSDIYGRKWPYIGSMVVQLLAIGGLLLSHSIVLTTALMFVVGMCSVGRWTVAYIYLLEMLTTPKQKALGPFVNASAGLGLISSTFYLTTISKNTMPYEFSIFILNLVSVVCGFFYLPESPRYLFAKQEFEKCKMILQRIARVNGSEKDLSIITLAPEKNSSDYGAFEINEGSNVVAPVRAPSPF